ncbi:MAG: hypothetical protein M3Q34_03655 [bacterium]|nr:hypothetical protein [bacterium]
MAKTTKQKMGKLYIITTVGIVVGLLTIGKYFIHESGLEFIVLNSLVGSVISSSIFITGFLLSGVFSDYKEVEKIPSEIRSSLESILGEGDALNRKDPSFDNNKIRLIVKDFVKEFEEGLSEVNDHSHLDHALEAIKDLDLVFDDMESRGVPPNYMTRLKSEQSHLRKMLLRVYHIQKTNFVPSVSVLVQSIVIIVIVLLAFVITEASAGITVFAVLSYLLIYTMQLIHVLEKPFRKGKDDTSDDVSIFLLRELSSGLDTK